MTTITCRWKKVQKGSGQCEIVLTTMFVLAMWYNSIAIYVQCPWTHGHVKNKHFMVGIAIYLWILLYMYWLCRHIVVSLKASVGKSHIKPAEHDNLEVICMWWKWKWSIEILHQAMGHYGWRECIYFLECPLSMVLSAEFIRYIRAQSIVPATTPLYVSSLGYWISLRVRILRNDVLIRE